MEVEGDTVGVFNQYILRHAVFAETEEAGRDRGFGTPLPFTGGGGQYMT